MKATFLIPSRGEFPRPRALELLLTGLLNLNVAIMERYTLPSLYSAGVRYRPDGEIWRNALAVLEATEADCKSLSAYRAAELIVRGQDARIVVHRSGAHTLHARVLTGGKIEAPSIRLGMKKRRVA